MKAVKIFFIRLLLLAFFPFSISSVQANASSVIEIRIMPDAIVYGERFSLGSVAEFEGYDSTKIKKLSKIDMGRSPLPGRSLILSQGLIKSRLRRIIKLSKVKLIMPKRPMVSRAALKITKKELDIIVTKEVAKLYNKFNDVNIHIQTRLRDTFIPKGEASYTIKRLGTNAVIGGYSTWKLQLKVDGKVEKRFWVRVKVDIVDKILVAKKRIQKGTIIRRADLKTIKRNISLDQKGLHPEQKLIIGQSARRDISANERVTKHVLEAPVIISEGKRIILEYKTKNLVMRTVVEALKDGKKGDIIPVKNLKSKRVIQAIVSNSAMVRVIL
ncbi:MAG: flagella basal body P-ring formation protein FlgA [bacterium]|jgi:flagella basal body P-ring formation protein FlgA